MSAKTTGRNLPLFAQPVNGSKFPAPLPTAGKQSGAFWSRPTVWSLAVLTCGVLMAFALPNKAQNVSNTQGNTPSVRASGGNPRSGQAGQGQTSASTMSASTAALLSDVFEDSRRPVDFYVQTVRSNMFTSPQPPAPPAVKAPVAAPAPAPVKPVVVPPVEINPFADWSYTGTMVSGDQTTALIENTKTKEGQFVKAGDTFMGAQIMAITDQQIVLQSGKTPRTLAKSDNITVTPLDRSAIPTTGTGQPQPGQQANAQPVQVQIDMSSMMNGMLNGRGGRNRGGGGNGQTFSLPNGRTFNPQQWQNRSQNLNRNFNQ